MKKVIVLNGPAGVGKDTFIELCRQAMETTGVPVVSFSSIDEVKQMALDMGWNGIKDEDGRRLLSTIKLASISANDGPTRYLQRMIEQTESGLVFLHIREPVEIRKLKALFPEVITCHLIRTGVEQFDNYSDRSTFDYEYDFHLENNSGLEHLLEVAIEFTHQIWREPEENNETRLEVR